MPRKATWLLMEMTELEFEHYLAVKLARTVAELRRSLSQGEWMRWTVYYGRLAQRQEMERLKAGG